jgi:hypothetical protein
VKPIQFAALHLEFKDNEFDNAQTFGMLMTHLLLLIKIAEIVPIHGMFFVFVLFYSVLGLTVGYVMLTLVGIHQGMGLTLGVTIVVFKYVAPQKPTQLMVLFILNGMIFGLQSGMILVVNPYNLNFPNVVWFWGSLVQVMVWFLFGSDLLYLFMLTVIQPFFWVLSHFGIAIEHTGFVYARTICLFAAVCWRADVTPTLAYSQGGLSYEKKI